MDKQEFINFVESGLNEADKNRLWLLLKDSKLTGINFLEQITEWKQKLINKEWIEGTPWNLPCKEIENIKYSFNKFIKNSF